MTENKKKMKKSLRVAKAKASKKKAVGGDAPLFLFGDLRGLVEGLESGGARYVDAFVEQYSSRESVLILSQMIAVREAGLEQWEEDDEAMVAEFGSGFSVEGRRHYAKNKATTAKLMGIFERVRVRLGLSVSELPEVLVRCDQVDGFKRFVVEAVAVRSVA